MLDTLDTLAKIKKEIKVVTLENPLPINIQGDSKNPDMIILNGTLTAESFDKAKKSIKNDGIIVLTKCDIPTGVDIKYIESIFGNAYKVVVEESSKGGYFVKIKNVVIFIKNLSKDTFDYSNAYFTFFSKDLTPIVHFGTLKTLLKDSEIEPEKEPEKEKKKKTSDQTESLI